MSSLFEITEDDAKRRRAALGTLLDMMDVPKLRKDLTKTANLRWLMRNISANNGDHPMTPTAKELIQWLLRRADG